MDRFDQVRLRTRHVESDSESTSRLDWAHIANMTYTQIVTFEILSEEDDDVKAAKKSAWCTTGVSHG